MDLIVLKGITAVGIAGILWQLNPRDRWLWIEEINHQLSLRRREAPVPCEPASPVDCLQALAELVEQGLQPELSVY